MCGQLPECQLADLPLPSDLSSCDSHEVVSSTAANRPGVATHNKTETQSPAEDKCVDSLPVVSIPAKRESVEEAGQYRRDGEVAKLGTRGSEGRGDEVGMCRGGGRRFEVLEIEDGGSGESKLNDTSEDDEFGCYGDIVIRGGDRCSESLTYVATLEFIIGESLGVVKHHWRTLIVTSLAWGLLDVTLYGTGSFKSRITEAYSGKHR